MRIVPFLLAGTALALAAGCASVPPEPLVVKLIAVNDFHGNLQSPGRFGRDLLVPAAQRPAVGGAEFVAASIAVLKARNPLNVVVAAGDLVGASPLISALFHDEPTVEVLSRAGLEVSSVGNHEFDKGAAELMRLQRGGCRTSGGVPDATSCRGFGSSAPGRFDGARFQWLSANVFETATGKTLLPAYGVKDFGAVKMAFIGMTLAATPGIVSPAGVAGLEFRDEADTVNALVPVLRAQGIEAIVVLVHQGGVQGSPGRGDIDGCDGGLKDDDGSVSDIEKVVNRLDDAVDLVISAHTHQAYVCRLANRAGRPIPVTSASSFGRVVSDIDVTIDPRTRDVIAVRPSNRLVDRGDPALLAAIAADPSIRRLVDAYDAEAAPLARGVVGTIRSALPSAVDAAGEMPAGDLIADAQLAATQPPALGGAVMAFTNPGGVRHPGLDFGGPYPYDVTHGNAFTTQPFGNSLVTLTLTATQLKGLLEQQFAGCLGQGSERILQVSNGVRVAWSASAPPCSKVKELSFTPTDVTVVPPVVTGPAEVVVAHGTVLNPSRSFRVTVNSYLAGGGDGFGVLAAGAAPLGGAQDLDALVAYLGGYKAPRAPYDRSAPALALPRITRLP